MSRLTRLTAAIALLGLLCGCRLLQGPDSTVQLLESELRWMEDNLYALDEQLEQCFEQLESARRNNEALRKELAEAHTIQQPATGTGATGGAEPEFDVPDDQDLYDLSSPLVETGEPSEPQPPARDTGDAAPEAAAEQPAPGDRIQVPEPIPAPEAEDSAAALPPNRDRKAMHRVDRIVLNRRLTGGYDLDQQLGHDGVMIVVEPQNRFAEYVAQPADLTIEVRDPAQPGLAGRIGKWKFDAVECAALMKKTTFGQGIHLRLPWPHRPPTNEALQLSVVYETTDGRRLKASRPVQIKAPQIAAGGTGPRASQWSPNRPPR